MMSIAAESMIMKAMIIINFPPCLVEIVKNVEKILLRWSALKQYGGETKTNSCLFAC